LKERGLREIGGSSVKQWNKKRLVLKLVITAIASPLVLLLLLFLHAFNVLAFISFPAILLGSKISEWIEAKSAQSIGAGLNNGLEITILVNYILVPLWTWLLLMIIVTLVERFTPRREKV
jgi:hypothetical protein